MTAYCPGWCQRGAAVAAALTVLISPPAALAADAAGDRRGHARALRPRHAAAGRPDARPPGAALATGLRSRRQPLRARTLRRPGPSGSLAHRAVDRRSAPDDGQARGAHRDRGRGGRLSGRRGGAAAERRAGDRRSRQRQHPRPPRHRLHELRAAGGPAAAPRRDRQRGPRRRGRGDDRRGRRARADALGPAQDARPVGAARSASRPAGDASTSAAPTACSSSTPSPRGPRTASPAGRARRSCPAGSRSRGPRGVVVSTRARGRSAGAIAARARCSPAGAPWSPAAARSAPATRAPAGCAGARTAQAQTIAAGRVYARSAVFDLATGKQVGAYTPVTSVLRFADQP